MDNYLKAEKLRGSSRSYKGLDQTNGKTVVIKYLPYGDEELVHLRTLKMLEFPFLVEVLDVQVVDGQLVVVEEFVENGSLRSLAGIINATLVSNLLEKMVRAIGFLHENQIYHGAISVDNVLVTKELLPKLQMVGVKRLPTPLNAFSQSQADDIYLLGKFTFELITGEELDSIEDADDDLRITEDIKVFLHKVIDADLQKIPTLENLLESDKYIRSLLGIDKQEIAEELEMQETSTHETTTSYAESVREQLIQSIASSQEKNKREGETQLDETVVDNVFILKMNSSETERFSVDDEDMNFQNMEGELQIMTAEVEEKKPTGSSADFDDDDDTGFQEVPCLLHVNTLEIRRTDDSDHSGDFDIPVEETAPAKIRFADEIDQLDNLIIDDADSNFDMDAEKEFGSVIIKKEDYDSPHVQLTPAAAPFESSSLRPREFDDDLDDQFDGLDDKNADLFASVVIPTQQPETELQLDFFDDDQGDNSLNFDDDELVEEFELIHHLGTGVTEELAFYKELCDILYLRRCHEQQYQDKTIDAIIQRAKLSDHIIGVTNNLYRFQSSEELLYFVRVVTLLMQLSSQFVFVMLFYQNIMSSIDISSAVSNAMETQLNEFCPNELFDQLTPEEKAITTHSGYLNTIVCYLLHDFKDKGNERLEQQCFDLFCKQDGLEQLLKYILCCDADEVEEKSTCLTIFGCDLFQALLKKYSEFRVDLYHKLEQQRPAEKIMERLFGFLLQVELDSPEYNSFRNTCVSFIIDFEQSSPTTRLSEMVQQLAQLTHRYQNSDQVMPELLDVLLVISKVFDDDLENLLCLIFGELLQQICFRYNDGKLETANKLIQRALLILMNIAFSSDPRRRLLCTEPLIESLANIAENEAILRQLALSLLLELLKIPIEISSASLLERLSCICVEALASELFILQAAQLLNRWQTIGLAEVQRFIPQLEKSDFESISSAALSQLAVLIAESPLLAQICFNRSLQRRCYLALSEENSTILSSLGIVLKCRHLLREPAIRKFHAAAEQLTMSANEQIKSISRHLLIELSGVVDFK